MFGPLVADYILGSTHSVTSHLLALNKITGLDEIDPVTNLTKGVLLGTALDDFD